MYSFKFSIALVTRNRPESLERCLHSLSLQEPQPFEIIVSDDSDPEYQLQTQAVVEKHGAKYIKGPQKGLYANRNFAAKACSGTHIRTMDDDHEFPEGHILACYQAIEEDQDSVWIIGEYYPWNPPEERKIPAPCPGQLHPRGFSVGPVDSQNCWAISCGASIYPRKLIDAGILNVEYFKFGASYLEYGARLNWLKYKIRHLSATYVIHHYYERSFTDEGITLPARLFAMLTFSFIYQKSMKNMMLTSLEIFKLLCLKPLALFKALREAVSIYSVHKLNLL